MRKIYNLDFAGFFYTPELWQADDQKYSAAAIHRFVDTLADQQVDTLAINPNTKIAWYPSEVWPDATERILADTAFANAERVFGFWQQPRFQQALRDMVDAGTDWIAAAVDRCHERGMSVWASIRMNDGHNTLDPADPLYNPLLCRPELLLDETPPAVAERYGTGASGLNYERAEVRDAMRQLIEELLMRYDLDGIELDWLRTPACCPPGTNAAAKTTVSDWHRGIGTLVRNTAASRRKRIEYGIRCPGNLQALPHLGLDVPAMLQDGLFDFLCPSSFMQTSWAMPHDRLRAEVPDSTRIYGVIELSTNFLWSKLTPRPGDPQRNPTNRHMCDFPAALRGNAAGKLVLGAEGIELYNFFVGDVVATYFGAPLRSRYEAIAPLADLEALRGTEKFYTLETVGRSSWAPPYDQPASLPTILQPGWQASFHLPMCREKGSDLSLVVQLVVLRTQATDEISVSLNGCYPERPRSRSDRLLFGNDPLGHGRHHPDHLALEYALPIDLLREGYNQITLQYGTDRSNSSADNESVQIESIELAVLQRKPKAASAQSCPSPSRD
jgi:hypothetical protein